MAKYNFEFKLKVVKKYLANEGSFKFLSEKYDIPSESSIERWVGIYKNLGSKGLMRSRKRKTYTFEFKQNVVELYLTTEISYQELALQFSINNPAMLCKWVNDYQIAGLDALKPRRRGRKPTMKKNKKDELKSKPKLKEKDQSDYLKQLEEENLRLRIENGYLKELRRQRLEEKPLKKKRE